MYFLDTHILIWFVNDSSSLSTKAKKVIGDCIKNHHDILISSISIWEISMLVNKGRLNLTMDIETWLAHLQKVPNLRFIPVDNEIGYKSTILPGDFHKDPADRMIVASAKKFAVPLITADKEIQKYPHVKTIF